jgi:hypothetical protein
VPKSPCDRTVAVTAIEHRNIVITVVSLPRESKNSALSTAQTAFVTTVLGGPLAGETWEGQSWSAMIRNHAGAVNRIAELVSSEVDQSVEEAPAKKTPARSQRKSA